MTTVIRENGELNKPPLELRKLENWTFMVGIVKILLSGSVYGMT